MAEPVLTPESQQVPPTSPNRVPTPSAAPTPPVSGPLASLEAVFYNWFVYKAPFQLPVGLTDFIVKAGPWITLVLAILLLPVIFGIIGLLTIAGSIVTTLGTDVAYHTGPNVAAIWISLIILIAQIVVMFVSIPMLLKRQRKGWQLLFYVDLINFAYGVVSGLMNGVYGIGSIIWAAISTTIGLYILFQIRRYYTK